MSHPIKLETTAVARKCGRRKNSGFKHLIFQPESDRTNAPDKRFYDSTYGKIESPWKVETGELTYTEAVPANTTATLHLPTVSETSVKENGKTDFR